MSFARNVSLLAAGAFVAFALTYFGAVEDVGEGAFYACFLGVGVWIMELSGRRRDEKADTEVSK